MTAPDSRPPVSAEEIDATRSERGGWTRETLARWGVPWPPPKGWRQALIEGNSKLPSASPRTPGRPVAEAPHLGGGQHIEPFWMEPYTPPPDECRHPPETLYLLPGGFEVQCGRCGKTANAGKATNR